MGFRRCLHLAAFLLLLALTACSESPTGRSQLALVPEGQMNALGDRTFAELLRSRPLVDDPDTLAYVECVANALVDVLGEEGGSWEVAVIDNPTPNAFALPGGHIGIHRGMLRVAESQDQLAAVIGHEIAHVLAEHSNERLTQELAVQGGLLLVDLLAEDAGSLGHEVLRKALGLGAEYGLLLPYSRAHEREADRLGRDLMARAGFDPRASLALWRNMARAAGEGPPEFLSTHPAHGSRMEVLEEGMDEALALQREAHAAGRRPDCGA
jgi:predicted Zn-dependent protease